MPEFVTQLASVRPWNEGAPAIHAPRAFGAGVDSPFYLPIPTVGERPVEYAADGLPDGLAIDPGTGIVTGRIAGEIEATVQITAANRHGRDAAETGIVVGGRLALIPPLGWNSWNCWGEKISQKRVEAAAEAMVSSGLAAHGYSYVNIDDGWQGLRGGPLNALQGNEKFPDMQALCETVHAQGLRIGIYSTPWVQSYARYPGGSTGEPVGDVTGDALSNGRYFGREGCEVADARQWAEWGFDYLKYDWRIDVPHVEVMRNALRASGRDIIYSLSNSAAFQEASEWARLADCWRTTGDIRDQWDSVSSIGFSQDRWTPYAGPGHWNDPDMLVVGRLGWGRVRENRLTRDEQITHLTLWAILAAPLLIGCDMTQLDDLTLRLLCNDEVLAVDQDPLGRQGHSIRDFRRAGDQGRTITHEAVYVRQLHDGSLAVALFNRGPRPQTIEITSAELGVEDGRTIRDLWANKDIGRLRQKFAMGVPSHGAQFIRLGP